MDKVINIEEALKRIEELEKENAELREKLEYYRNRKLSGRQKHNAKWMAIYNDFVVGYESGMTMVEIAKQNNVSERTIYRYKAYYDKMKKKDGEMSIELDRTHDILKYMGEHRREGQFYCGFSMETQNMLENSRVKLDKKNIDLVIANNLKVAGSGFGTDTNVVTMISKQEEIQLELLTKEEVAHKILDEILKLKG